MCNGKNKRNAIEQVTDMNSMVCPMCGSRYFLSMRSAQKVVFQVQCDGEKHVLEVAEETGSEDAVNREEIFCSSCSWHGPIEETIEAR